MRVLLIWTQNDRAVLSDALSCCEPLPLEYLAGSLREFHDAVIYDQRLDPPLSVFAENEPHFDLIGISIPYTSSAWTARDAAYESHRLWPEAKIVVGGHHPTVSAEWLDDFPADYVIIGEGGEALKTLAGFLEQKKTLGQIPGLFPFKDFSSASLSKRPVNTSLDHLPMPDRTLLKHHREKYFHSIYNPIALVRFSAGCPYSCSFCILWKLTDQKYLTKSATRILAELETISVNNIYVVDDEAFIQPTRMKILANLIIESGMNKKFHMYLRTDTALRHPDLIERWAEAGLDSVLVGAESIIDEDLISYNKGTNVTQTVKAIELFHRLGIKVRANFIVKPDYTEKNFRTLAQSVADLKVDLPSFAVLTPLPGTELYERERGSLISDNPDLYDCYHTLFPTKLPLEKFYSCFSDLLRQSALINKTNAGGQKGASHSGMFYFSSDNAFSNMVSAISNGSRLHQISWQKSFQASN